MFTDQTKDHQRVLDTNISKLQSELLLYRKILDTSMEAIILVDKQKKILSANTVACNLLRVTANEVEGLSFLEFLSMVPNQILAYQDEQLAVHLEFQDEWLICLNDGTVKHVEYHAFLEQENVLYKLKDITIQKQAERERDISFHLFKDVFHQAVDGIVIYNQKGVIIDANPSFLKLVNRERENVVDETIHNFIAEHSKREWNEKWKELLSKGTSQGEVTLKVSDQYRYVEFTTSSNVYNGHFMSIFRDVTERKLMEQQLNKSEELFSVLFEQAIDGIVLTDGAGNIIKANNSACKIFESALEKLIGTNVQDYIMNPDRRFQRLLQSFRETGAIRDELFYLMPNGQKKLLEFTSKMLQEGHITLTIYRNVSERWDMEMKLRKSENKFRKIFEGSMDGLILWNEKGLANINEAGSAIFEMSKETLLSKPMDELINFIPENKEEIQKVIKRVQKQNKLNTTAVLHFKDGRKKYIEYSTKLNLISGMHLTAFKDVTEKLEMQEQLRKSDTLNVVGELAAGIAHEIRNPMTALKGFIQLLQGSVKEDFTTYFSVINSELNRIESIITEFLILAKPQAIQYLQKDINLIIQETVELLRAQALLQNVVLKPVIKKPIFLYCEGNQLKQVLINIIKNALEAMPIGGNIAIESTLWKEEFVKISIQDEGCGISEEKIKKLGEPFYTTKDRGTGLGLMVSYKIIEEHHGWIEVESEINQGTTFHIHLPLNLLQEEEG
ncbi:PAS domain-containing sensor histidine kinase [Peribacillus alkalitolerans]|uniref:PAS domain-containing sensor histidine kinase n=1 Tax=Peribacillus alkalitolerans TaxID=1550385 RepID=UPI0013D6FDBC|nr:PAS domain-containing sensor histidine kinase [Peribacillus alkalitolerans]